MSQQETEVPGQEPEEARSAYVTAFSRGLSVIRCFSESNSSLTISDVARATGLNRATARRFLHTLEADGYVAASDGRYALRPKVLDLGYAYLSSISINDIFQQHLAELADKLHESCSAGVLEDDDVVFVARARTTHPRMMTLAISVGSRLPAHLSAIGRVLLAELPDAEIERRLRRVDLRKETERTLHEVRSLESEILRVRSDGYCVIDQEMETGILAAAVPVHRAGHPTIGISVAMHNSRASVDVLREEYVPVLREAAADLERVLGFRF
jgi:IclR family transcriptional regulator, pca regulon regulatory protein